MKLEKSNGNRKELSSKVQLKLDRWLLNWKIFNEVGKVRESWKREPLEDVDGPSRKNKAVSETVLFSKLNMVPMQN